MLTSNDFVPHSVACPRAFILEMAPVIHFNKCVLSFDTANHVANTNLALKLFNFQHLFIIIIIAAVAVFTTTTVTLIIFFHHLKFQFQFCYFFNLFHLAKLNIHLFILFLNLNFFSHFYQEFLFIIIR